jgi:hypothetical protein
MIGQGAHAVSSLFESMLVLSISTLNLHTKAIP